MIKKIHMKGHGCFCCAVAEDSNMKRKLEGSAALSNGIESALPRHLVYRGRAGRVLVPT